MNATDVRIQGWDVSLEHAGFVELDGVGRLRNYWYMTNLVGSMKRKPRNSARSHTSKSKDKQQRSVERLIHIAKFIKSVVLCRTPHYIGIEDYALREAQGAHQLGEIGGIARMLAYMSGAKMRLHDPTTLKMYATHDGACSKEYMRHKCLERWKLDEFLDCDQPKAIPTKKNPDPKPNLQTSGDLVDAYAIARMVWIEIEIRAGRIPLKRLHEKERRVFMRVTRSFPVNLLDREWIQKI